MKQIQIDTMLPYILVIFLMCVSAGAQETTYTISLNKTITNTDRELHSSIINITELSTVKFDFINVNANISFIIFQAHSQFYNITMYNNTLKHDSTVEGTNVGMYSSVQPIDTFYIKNENQQDLKLLIAVHGYTAEEPVPGGCNMEFDVPTAPYLAASLSSSRTYVTVDGAAPRPIANGSCDNPERIVMTFYRLYLPERDFSIETYFAGIHDMMNLGSIEENGEAIPKSTAVSALRRTLSAYPGTGSVYVAMAEVYSKSDPKSNLFVIHQSAYVPIVHYACSPMVENGCDLLGDLLSQVLCASLLFLGLFLCYLGHRFFKTEMFIFGMLSGVIVTYIVIAMITKIDHAPLMGASFLSGLLFGCIWLTFWWFYGIPILSMLLVTLSFGFFAASVLYLEIPGGDRIPILTIDMNFWSIFLMTMIITSTILLGAAYPANVLSCAILGAYAAVFPIDYCLGSNLKYILINVVRRATVEDFNRAILSMPFQIYDAVLTLLWVALATTGFLFQHYHNRGRAAFPPPPREARSSPDTFNQGYNTFRPAVVISRIVNQSTRSANENSPLLS